MRSTISSDFLRSALCITVDPRHERSGLLIRIEGVSGSSHLAMCPNFHPRRAAMPMRKDES